MGEAGLFELVKLETRDGGHVGWAMIPRFNPAADVLVWGQRIFYDAAAVDADADYRLYREAFAWAVVTPVTGARPDPSESC